MSYENLKQPAINRINEIIIDKSKYEPEYLEYIVKKSVEHIYRSHTINDVENLKFYEEWLFFLQEKGHKSLIEIMKQLSKEKKLELKNIFMELFKSKRDPKWIFTGEMEMIIEDKINYLKKSLVNKKIEIRKNGKYQLLFEYLSN